MARHMALWHTLKGEDDLARVASGAAGKVEQTLTDSALAWVMLRRTMSPALPDDLRPRYELGDPTFRQHLKFTFFEDIQHPKARDLAELDLIELMSDYLEQSLVFVRSEHYPAYEEQATLAASVGREMVEQIYSDAPWELGDFRKKLFGYFLQNTKMTAEEIGTTLSLLFGRGVMFVRTVCDHCPVKCFFDPNQDVTEEFFSQQHPAGSLLESFLENSTCLPEDDDGGLTDLAEDTEDSPEVSSTSRNIRKRSRKKQRKGKKRR